MPHPCVQSVNTPAYLHVPRSAASSLRALRCLQQRRRRRRRRRQRRGVLVRATQPATQQATSSSSLRLSSVSLARFLVRPLARPLARPTRQWLRYCARIPGHGADARMTSQTVIVVGSRKCPEARSLELCFVPFPVARIRLTPLLALAQIPCWPGLNVPGICNHARLSAVRTTTTGTTGTAPSFLAG